MQAHDDTRRFILDAAVDLKEIAERIEELADNGSGYSMSVDQLRICAQARTAASCARIIIETATRP